MPIFTMTQMDARITERVARLTALERERVEILAEDCPVSPAFPRPLGCLPDPLAESHDGAQRVRT
ncbi:MAG: hypothetical protein WB420_14700, partial [Bradyrhizobium sp.]